MAPAPDITRSGHPRPSSPDLAASVPLLPIPPVKPALPDVPMIEVGRSAQEPSFSRESPVLLLLILFEIFLFNMRFLVSAGPLLGQSIEERRITSACPLAPRTAVKRCAREKFRSDFLSQSPQTT